MNTPPARQISPVQGRWGPPDVNAWDLTENTFLAYDFAILNPIQLDGILWQDLPNTAIVPLRYRSQEQLFPRLIALGQLDRQARMDLFQRHLSLASAAQTDYFCLLLRCSLPGVDVARHFARQMEQYDPRRMQQDVLRLHDPRVLRHLDWILTQAQWDNVLGPIERVAWPLAALQWVHRDHDATAHTSSNRLVLAEHQWAQVVRLAEVNQCLLVLQRRLPDLEVQASVSARVDRLLAKAAQVHGLQDRADRILFVEQAFQFGDQIHGQPVLREALARAGGGEASYIGLCAEMMEPLQQRPGT
ncbi:DUF4123 domain-containing protein [Xanthomonas oryzae pv. oryzicola]|nr:DUF4123 domain-containing protein [Xanthomonas oryzae pv. oryzicola]ULX26114.1 DUF4123 domain-containing protein [Xanthomonas oryzae pv. oryzicola]UNW44230.1 DUF4123 domain-containing protein [Xanthomonas oryzae pv. oryzicola]